jgi:molybdenum cofactor cytidylyltransferase
MPDVAAILLAAGGSSRMGRPKQLLRAVGQSLVRRAALAALDASCNPVIVVTGSQAESVSPEIADLPVTIQFNPRWSAGIGSSIRAGLSAVLSANPSVDATIFLLCDQPHLTANVLRDLISTWSQSGKPIAACEYSRTVGPPCCFAASIFDQLSRIPDPDGAKKILLANPDLVTSFSWPGGADDLDTPADWQRFCQNNPRSPESPA